MKIESNIPISFNLASKPLSEMEHSAPNFTHFLTDTLQTTNTALQNADLALQQLASGQADNLHQTMLTLEEAKLSFQFLQQLRNRLMTAWQDILKEPI
jgi:flagellar hook-basal body complex protein FliE